MIRENHFMMKRGINFSFNRTVQKNQHAFVWENRQ